MSSAALVMAGTPPVLGAVESGALAKLAEDAADAYVNGYVLSSTEKLAATLFPSVNFLSLGLLSDPPAGHAQVVQVSNLVASGMTTLEIYSPQDSACWAAMQANAVCYSTESYYEDTEASFEFHDCGIVLCMPLSLPALLPDGGADAGAASAHSVVGALMVGFEYGFGIDSRDGAFLSYLSSCLAPLVPPILHGFLPDMFQNAGAGCAGEDGGSEEDAEPTVAGGGWCVGIDEHPDPEDPEEGATSITTSSSDSHSAPRRVRALSTYSTGARGLEEQRAALPPPSSASPRGDGLTEGGKAAAAATSAAVRAARMAAIEELPERAEEGGPSGGGGGAGCGAGGRGRAHGAPSWAAARQQLLKELGIEPPGANGRATGAGSTKSAVMGDGAGAGTGGGAGAGIGAGEASLDVPSVAAGTAAAQCAGSSAGGSEASRSSSMRSSWLLFLSRRRRKASGSVSVGDDAGESPQRLESHTSSLCDSVTAVTHPAAGQLDPRDLFHCYYTLLERPRSLSEYAVERASGSCSSSQSSFSGARGRRGSAETSPNKDAGGPGYAALDPRRLPSVSETVVAQAQYPLRSRSFGWEASPAPSPRRQASLTSQRRQRRPALHDDVRQAATAAAGRVAKEAGSGVAPKGGGRAAGAAAGGSEGGAALVGAGALLQFGDAARAGIAERWEAVGDAATSCPWRAEGGPARGAGLAEGDVMDAGSPPTGLAEGKGRDADLPTAARAGACDDVNAAKSAAQAAYRAAALNADGGAAGGCAEGRDADAYGAGGGPKEPVAAGPGLAATRAPALPRTAACGELTFKGQRGGGVLPQRPLALCYVDPRCCLAKHPLTLCYADDRVEGAFRRWLAQRQRMASRWMLGLSVVAHMLLLLLVVLDVKGWGMQLLPMAAAAELLCCATAVRSSGWWPEAHTNALFWVKCGAYQVMCCQMQRWAMRLAGQLPWQGGEPEQPRGLPWAQLLTAGLVALEALPCWAVWYNDAPRQVLVSTWLSVRLGGAAYSRWPRGSWQWRCWFLAVNALPLALSYATARVQRLLFRRSKAGRRAAAEAGAGTGAGVALGA